MLGQSKHLPEGKFGRCALSRALIATTLSIAVSGVLPVIAFADVAGDADASSTAGTPQVKDAGKHSHHGHRDADESKQHRQSESGKGHHKNSAIGKGAEGTGLDAATLDLVNRGQWQAVETRLATRNAPVGSRDSAWLAFTYMYMGQCDELHTLATKARAIYDAREAVHLPAPALSGAKASNSTATPSATATTKTSTSTAASPAAATTTTSSATTSSSKPTSPTTTSTSKTDSQPGSGKSPTNESETYALLVQVYDEICATRFADAAAELDNVPAWFRYDSLTNFTLAALAGKQARTADAIEYMERAVGAAPDFAWGYRTVGKLEQKRMNSGKAENFYVSALAITPDLSEVVDALVDIRLKNNNFDGAVDVAKAAINQSPKDSSNYYRLAQIYIQQWRLREALTELKTAIDLDPDVARYYRSRATIKRYQNDLNEAIADEQKAVDLSKDKTFELVELAGMNLAAGNTNRAADNLQEALKIDANNQVAHDKLIAILLQEKRYDDLTAEYNRVLTLKPKDTGAMLGLARALLAQGKTEPAIEKFKEVANLDPNNPDPHRELGALRLRQKDFAAAAREYTHALNINPSSVPDLVALGYAYSQNDDYAQAEAALVTGLALQQLTQPNIARTSTSRLDLMRALAVLLMDEGRYSEAAAQFDSIYAGSKGTDNERTDYMLLAQAKALRDLNMTAAKVLIAAYQSLSPEKQVDERPFLITTLLEANKPALALQFISEEEKVRSDASDSRMKITRARALLQDGKIDEASALVSNLTPTETNRTASEVSNQYVTLSEIAMAKGDMANADALAAKAIEKYPKNFRAYIQRGRVAVKEKKYSDAMELAKHTLEINQYATDAYLVYGDAQSDSGKTKDASVSYRRAAELYPGLLSAHKALLETLRKLAMKDEAKREEDQIAQMEKQQ